MGTTALEVWRRQQESRERITIPRRWEVVFVAWAEILGGAAGAGLTVWIGFFAWPVGAFGIPFLLVYLWAIVAGWRLWQRDSRGLRHSRIIQWLSLPAITTPAFQYLLTIGAGGPLQIGFIPASSTVHLSTTVHLGSQWLLVFGTAAEGPWLFGLNAGAIVCLILLRRVRRELAG